MFRAISRTPPLSYGIRSGPQPRSAAFVLSRHLLIAVGEHEIRQGANTEATEQSQARAAATLTNLAKQVQGLQTLAHAQVALTDDLLNIRHHSCVVEPPGDDIPAAGFARGAATKAGACGRKGFLQQEQRHSLGNGDRRPTSP